MKFISQFLVLLSAGAVLAESGSPWLALPGGPGPGQGKSVVLVSGDEEYRSEESFPMLAGILSRRYGFRCTVLFAVNRQTGEIDPNVRDNIPGLEALRAADLMVVCTRFRELPDEQFRHVDDYLESGKPVIGLRPAVVAFRNRPDSRYFKYSSDNATGPCAGGFGRQVLGATWIAHHGDHGRESTRGLPRPDAGDHPILRGVGTLWGPTDVYVVRTPIPHGGQVLVDGVVLRGMRPDDPPSDKDRMPLAWTKTYPTARGNARVFMSTLGASQDFENENFRRLVVNACLWAVGLEDRIPAKSDVDYAGSYKPTAFGFDTFRKGLTPAGLAAEFSRAAGVDLRAPALPQTP